MLSDSDVHFYLNKICVEFGFCLPPGAIQDLVWKNSYTADEFIREIFKIEGLLVEEQLSMFRKLKRVFIAQFGDSHHQGFFEFTE